MINSEFEPRWKSHALAEKEEETEISEENLVERPETLFESKADLASKMVGLRNLPQEIQESLVDLVYRVIFSPVVPGAIKKYYHIIDILPNKRPASRTYPIKSS